MFSSSKILHPRLMTSLLLGLEGIVCDCGMAACISLFQTQLASEIYMFDVRFSLRMLHSTFDDHILGCE